MFVSEWMCVCAYVFAILFMNRFQVMLEMLFYFNAILPMIKLIIICTFFKINFLDPSSLHFLKTFYN